MHFFPIYGHVIRKLNERIMAQIMENDLRANHTVKIIGINMRSNRQLNNFQKHFDFTYLSFKTKTKA